LSECFWTSIPGGRLALPSEECFQSNSQSGWIVDIRPSAFAALGQLVLAMNDPGTGRLIGGSPSPTVKILNSRGPDLKASVIIEIFKNVVSYMRI
jgi:hypothetical protein